MDDVYAGLMGEREGIEIRTYVAFERIDQVYLLRKYTCTHTHA